MHLIICNSKCFHILDPHQSISIHASDVMKLKQPIGQYDNSILAVLKCNLEHNDGEQMHFELEIVSKDLMHTETVHICIVAWYSIGKR